MVAAAALDRGPRQGLAAAIGASEGRFCSVDRARAAQAARPSLADLLSPCPVSCPVRMDGMSAQLFRDRGMAPEPLTFWRMVWAVALGFLFGNMILAALIRILLYLLGDA